MAQVILGQEGVLNADLIIVQNASYAATFIHEDPTGDPIDHTGWTGRARIQGNGVNLVLDSYVSFGEDGAIQLAIPASETAGLKIGRYGWDLMCEDAYGFITRLIYGKAKVYDSYAYDRV